MGQGKERSVLKQAVKPEAQSHRKLQGQCVTSYPKRGEGAGVSSKPRQSRVEETLRGVMSQHLCPAQHLEEPASWLWGPAGADGPGQGSDAFQGDSPGTSRLLTGRRRPLGMNINLSEPSLPLGNGLQTQWGYLW